MTPSIRNVTVLGAGTMGEGIAQVTASARLPTRLFDSLADRAGDAISRIGARLGRLVAKGEMDADQQSGAIAALVTAGDVRSACEGADLVIEATPEDMDRKVALRAEVVAAARPHALVASSTSSLSVSEMGARAGAAERTLGLHFFNPAPVMALLEIVRGVSTSEAAIEAGAGLRELHWQEVYRRSRRGGLCHQSPRRAPRRRSDPHAGGRRRGHGRHRPRDGARLRPPDGAAQAHRLGRAGRPPRHPRAPAGALDAENVPVLLPRRDGAPLAFARDESPRPNTSLEALSRLSHAFRPGGTVTAGNSAPLNDGAAAVLLVSEDFVRRRGLVPLARVVAHATAGVHPNLMGEGPIPAGKRALRDAGWSAADVDLVELNEAFAAQCIACTAGSTSTRTASTSMEGRSRSATPSARGARSRDARLGHEGAVEAALDGGALHRRRTGNRHAGGAMMGYMESPMTSAAEHPYASFVHLVQKPARYLGGEFGARPKDWAAVESRICLAFPDIYDIGMSHLGFKILYKLLNDDPRTLAERAYAPWIDMEAQLRARGVPLVSCESARPLRDFDVVGFSLQFELTYTNVLAMLELGGIPLRADARGEDDPLVLAGGPTATHPEPLSPFVDAIVIGDGEERTTEVALTWSALKKSKTPRRERLRALARLKGVYVPSLYDWRVDPDTGFTVVVGSKVPDAPMPVVRTLVDDLNRFPFPDDGPIGGPEAIFDRMSIEIARGCTEGCRFCQAGMIYRPVRERDPEQIVATVVSAIKKSGYDEASLTSLSTADYSCIAPLVKKVTDQLAPKRVSLGVSSLRAYGLEENVLDDIARVRATGVTFAPEAGTQRLRDVINKNVTEEQLLQTAERVFSRGWQSMKLYFMIGLPTEDEDDVRAIPRVGGRARAIGQRVKRELGLGGSPKVTVSVSTHVPKPHTPFQWCAMDTSEAVRQKQGWLQEEARTANVELRVHDSNTSWLEGVFARGDRSLGGVLERAYRAGARFDSWDDQQKTSVWEDAFRAEGIDPFKYLGTIPVTARLPWDHIDVGLEEGFLLREYRKALKDRLSLPCGKVAGAFVHATNLAEATREEGKLVCYDCGIACDLGALRDQRLVYLRKLGADEPRAPSPPRQRAAGCRPPPASPGEARRYRFVYEKLHAAAFLSHLDLIRALPRAFRRLELPLHYSTGFHPKPEMMFGPALSLGVASLCEVVDVKISSDLDPATLLESLSAGSQPGLRFVAGARLGQGDSAITRIIDCGRYVVGIPSHALEPRGGLPWLEERIHEARAARELIVLRRIEKVTKRVDVRSFLRSIERGGEAASSDLERAGFGKDLVPIAVDVDIRGSGAVKIAEVVEALCGEPGIPVHAVRVALGRRGRDDRVVLPLDLGGIRAAREAFAPGQVASPAE